MKVGYESKKNISVIIGNTSGDVMDLKKVMITVSCGGETKDHTLDGTLSNGKSKKKILVEKPEVGKQYEVQVKFDNEKYNKVLTFQGNNVNTETSFSNNSLDPTPPHEKQFTSGCVPSNPEGGGSIIPSANKSNSPIHTDEMDTFTNFVSHSEVSEMENELKEYFGEQLNQLRTQITQCLSIYGKDDDLQNVKSKVQGWFNDLQNSLKNHVTRMNSLTSNHDELKGYVSTLQFKLQSAEKEIAEHKNTIQKLNQKVLGTDEVVKFLMMQQFGESKYLSKIALVTDNNKQSILSKFASEFKRNFPHITCNNDISQKYALGFYLISCGTTRIEGLFDSKKLSQLREQCNELHVIIIRNALNDNSFAANYDESVKKHKVNSIKDIYFMDSNLVNNNTTKQTWNWINNMLPTKPTFFARYGL